MSAGRAVSSDRPPPGPDSPWKASLLQMFRSPRRQEAHSPQLYEGRTAAFWPTRSVSTPSPTSTTMPQNSWPSTTGALTPVSGCGCVGMKVGAE